MRQLSLQAIRDGRLEVGSKTPKKAFRKWQIIVAFISVLAIAGIVLAFWETKPIQKPASMRKFSLTGTILSSYSRITKSTAKISYSQTGPVSIAGTGVYDFTANIGQMNFTTQTNGHSIKSSWIFGGNVIYKSTPQWPGKWLRVPFSGNNFSLMSPFAFLNPTPARTILEHFAGNGVTERHSNLAGEPTTEYVGHVEPPKVLTSGQLPTVPFPVVIKVWVDGTGTVRQIQTAFSLPLNPSGHAVSPQVSTIQFSNFGAPVSVSPPP